MGERNNSYKEEYPMQKNTLRVTLKLRLSMPDMSALTNITNRLLIAATLGCLATAIAALAIFLRHGP